MSSFTINKVEYMKAGGFVAGLMSEFHSRGVWDDVKQGWADKGSYRRWFSECYSMNRESVSKQYNAE